LGASQQGLEADHSDLYELLRKELSECEISKVVLLGSHGPEQNEDGLLKEAVRRIVEGWPPPPFRISGRDEGRSAENFWLRPADKPGSAFRKAFERVLRKCGVHAGPGPAVYRRQATSSQRSVETVLPNARDRTDPRTAQLPWASSAILSKRIIGATTQAIEGPCRAFLP
jgi:hypothetical protein